MGKVIAYKNTEKICFCQIQFESKERVMVSIASNPEHSIKVIKLLAGIFPYKTIWEFRVSSSDVKEAHKKMLSMFKGNTTKPVDHPLDAIMLKLVSCNSCYDAVSTLLQAEGKRGL